MCRVLPIARACAEAPSVTPSRAIARAQHAHRAAAAPTQVSAEDNRQRQRQRSRRTFDMCAACCPEPSCNGTDGREHHEDRRVTTVPQYTKPCRGTDWVTNRPPCSCSLCHHHSSTWLPDQCDPSGCRISVTPVVAGSVTPVVLSAAATTHEITSHAPAPWLLYRWWRVAGGGWLLWLVAGGIGLARSTKRAVARAVLRSCRLSLSQARAGARACARSVVCSVLPVANLNDLLRRCK